MTGGVELGSGAAGRRGRGSEPLPSPLMHGGGEDHGRGGGVWTPRRATSPSFDWGWRPPEFPLAKGLTPRLPCVLASGRTGVMRRPASAGNRALASSGWTRSMAISAEVKGRTLLLTQTRMCRTMAWSPGTRTPPIAEGISGLQDREEVSSSVPRTGINAAPGRIQSAQARMGNRRRQGSWSYGVLRGDTQG